VHYSYRYLVTFPTLHQTHSKNPAQTVTNLQTMGQAAGGVPTMTSRYCTVPSDLHTPRSGKCGTIVHSLITQTIRIVLSLFPRLLPPPKWTPRNPFPVFDIPTQSCELSCRFSSSLPLLRKSQALHPTTTHHFFNPNNLNNLPASQSRRRKQTRK